jgi:hypothetical protein
MERIIGSLAIELREPDGTVVLRRTARNSVMRGGAELIADLFRGTAATPVNGMAVGLSSEPSAPPFDSSALTTTNPDASPALTRFAIPLAPDATSVTVLEDALKVRVRVRGLVPADFAQNADTTQTSVAIGEAALGVLAADGASLARLYNRVAFEPIQKEQDQEIALYWDIDFPFGS